MTPHSIGKAKGARNRSRRAFVLPFVVLALAAASLLTLAFTGEALQAARAISASVRGDDARYRTDAALSGAMELWTRDSLWTHPPGESIRSTLLMQGEPVSIEWQRLHPLAATVRATSRTSGARALDATIRDHLRAVWLAPPAVPIAATMTATGNVTGADGTLVSGSDVVLPGSPCGPTRDTASVAPVMALAVNGALTGTWSGAPQWIAVTPSVRDSVHAALAIITHRVPARSWDTTPQAFPVSEAWHAVRIQGPAVNIAGPTEWRGLAVLQGPVTFSGAVHVTGLLVVEGELDASAAHLSVQGAVVAADTSARGVMLGAHSRLFYDRCAVQMALATVARPSLAPFSLWQSLPH